MKSQVTLLGALLIVALLGAAGSAHAASVAIQHSSVISLDGEIDSATVERFSTVLERATGNWCMVMLDSVGGDVVAALAIGRMIRARNCKTTVAGNYVCASACIFILAAGVDRHVYGARIGIHRPHFEDAYFAGLSATKARAQYQQLEGETRGYLREMGMPDELFIRMMRIPSSSIQWLTATDVRSLGLVGNDAAYGEWLRAQYVRQFGPNGYQRHLKGVELLENCANAAHGTANAGPKCQQDVLQRYPEVTWEPRAR